MSGQGSQNPTPPQNHGPGTQLDMVNALASQIVTPLQNIVTKLGQILQAMGSLAGAYAIKTITFANSPYTTFATDEFLLVDATGGNVVINLSANGSPQISAMKIDASGNSVELVGTINTATNLTTTTQYKAYNAKRDASNNWWLF